MAINVFLADDHQTIIDGLKNSMAYEDDLVYIGKACNADELIERITDKVDILLLDVFEEKVKFLDLIRIVSQKYPTIGILVLSATEDVHFAQETVKIGTRGYMSKALSVKEIFNTIREAYKYPAMTHFKLPNPITTDVEQREVSTLITPRELQVISLLTKGFTNNKEIANFLSDINKSKRPISEGTIQAHRRNIRRKLSDYGVTNDASLGYWTCCWKLLDGSELSSTEDI